MVCNNKVYSLPIVSKFGGTKPRATTLEYHVGGDRCGYGVAQYEDKFIYIFGGYTYAH